MLPHSQSGGESYSRKVYSFSAKSPWPVSSCDKEWSTSKKSHFTWSTGKMGYACLPLLETSHLTCHSRSAQSRASVTEVTGIPCVLLFSKSHFAHRNFARMSICNCPAITCSAFPRAFQMSPVRRTLHHWGGPLAPRIELA